MIPLACFHAAIPKVGADVRTKRHSAFTCCRWLVQQLEKNLGQELDFRLEANNAARLAAYMADNRNVAVPQPVPGVRAYVPSP